MREKKRPKKRNQTVESSKYGESKSFGGISKVSSLSLSNLAPLKVHAYTGCSTCSGRSIQSCC